jgi:hypothetical protein
MCRVEGPRRRRGGKSDIFMGIRRQNGMVALCIKLRLWPADALVVQALKRLPPAEVPRMMIGV